MTLRPPPEATLTIGLRTGGREYRLRVEDGWVQARRGLAEDADLRLVGTPWEVMATLVAEQDLGELGAEVEGDPAALEALRAWSPSRTHTGRAPRPRWRRRYLSSAELLPSSWRATISSWICWVPSKMSRILASRAHFSSSSFSP